MYAYVHECVRIRVCRCECICIAGDLVCACGCLCLYGVFVLAIMWLFEFMARFCARGYVCAGVSVFAVVIMVVRAQVVVMVLVVAHVFAFVAAFCVCAYNYDLLMLVSMLFNMCFCM